MRSAFGSIIPRKNNAGLVTSLQARYTNPVDTTQRVTKKFPVDAKAQAQAWLDSEEKLVDAHYAGTIVWTSPKAREQAEQRKEVLFSDYADDYLKNYRSKDNKELAPGSLRKKREAINHLKEAFGTKLLSEITTKDVNEWLDSGDVDGVHALRRSYQVLKAIIKKAMTSTDDEPAILDHDPCTRPNPKLPKSKQALIPEAESDELKDIYDAMPGYTRISIYIGAIFGLRISEICALRREDFDFKHGLLRIRHAPRRSGKNDTGPLELDATKTEDSEDNLPIPKDFVPLIKAHLSQYSGPSGDSMVLTPKNSKIMAPGTIRTQFDKARKTAGRPDLHLHTLRATAITAASRVVGSTPKEVQKYGRHASAKISLELYQRASNEGEKRIANEVFSALVKPERTLDVVSAEHENAVQELKDAQRKVDQLEEELKKLRE